MHKAILLLVEAHARVGNVAPALITRVLEALVNVITQVAMDCFQQIPKFGTGGMLTVRSCTLFSGGGGKENGKRFTLINGCR